MKHDDTELSQEQTPQEQLAEAPTQPQKFFVVDYRDLAEIRVAEFSYLEAAQAACPAEGGASVVTNQEALQAFDGNVLVAIYNRIRRGAPVKGFHDKMSAAKRIWLLLEHYAPGYINPSAASVDEQPQEAEVAKTAKKSSSKKNGAAKKAPKEKKVRAASNGTTKGPRGDKTKEIARLLQRKSGVTRAEILAATGWPSVSVQAIAKSLGFKLTKSREKGSPTSYFGEPK